MPHRRNRQVILAERPLGTPQASHFTLGTTSIGEPNENEILVRNLFLSVDPAMRGWLCDASTTGNPILPGDVIRALAVGEVIETRHPGYVIGEHLVGMFGWQEYAIAQEASVLLRIPDQGLPLSLYLGVLGMNGMAAYFGLLDICEPKAGETVVVSTAAGAVGSCVGQIAKLKGCRTVGITGGSEKVRLCMEQFGYDAGIDYRSEVDLDAALDRACPEGVDIYFDNTSGAISDAVLRHINIGARIAVCGTAAIETWVPWASGPRPERSRPSMWCKIGCGQQAAFSGGLRCNL